MRAAADPVRALAADEGANPLTVAKAYQGFQDDGLSLVKRGVGMFVLPGAAEKLRVAERDRLRQFGDADQAQIAAALATAIGIEARHIAGDGETTATLATEGSLNNETGVPLTLLAGDQHTRVEQVAVRVRSQPRRHLPQRVPARFGPALVIQHAPARAGHQILQP